MFFTIGESFSYWRHDRERPADVGNHHRLGYSGAVGAQHNRDQMKDWSGLIVPPHVTDMILRILQETGRTKIEGEIRLRVEGQEDMATRRKRFTVRKDWSRGK